MTCFTLLCSRAGLFTWLITISQVVQKRILKAFTLLHKSLSNYLLRGLPFPGITTAFIEGVFEQTEASFNTPDHSSTLRVFQHEPNLMAFNWIQLLLASKII